MDRMHSLLRRQLKAHFGNSENTPSELREFVEAVNSAYWESDDDRLMLERSLELRSQELLKANLELREIFQLFPDMFFRADSTGKIVDYHTGSIQLGNPEKAFIGKHMRELPLGDSAPSLLEGAANQALNLQSTAVVVLPLEIRGRKYFFEASVLPVFEGQVIAFFRDVTERVLAEEGLRKARDELELRVEERTVALEATNRALQAEIAERKAVEAALRASEERYRQMAENIHDGLTIVENGQVVYSNRRISEIFGYTAAEYASLNMFSMASPEDVPKLRAVRDKLPLSTDLSDDFNYWAICKDGHRCYVSNRYSIVIKDDGTVVLYLVTTDTTERKLTEDRLRASLKEKEVLLKEIHHRVKNNLQVITSLLNLQAASITAPEVREIFRVSQDRIRSMALIHEKLYKSADLSRINFADYLRSLVSNLKKSYSPDTRGIRIELAAAEEPLAIDVAVPCGLIVNELIVNSFKHAFPGNTGGVIRVEFGREGDGFLLRVSDNGVGLPAGLEIASVTSLGMQLIQILAEQIGGTVQMSGDRGTSCHVRFKI